MKPICLFSNVLNVLIQAPCLVVVNLFLLALTYTKHTADLHSPKSFLPRANTHKAEVSCFRERKRHARYMRFIFNLLILDWAAPPK